MRSGWISRAGREAFEGEVRPEVPQQRCVVRHHIWNVPARVPKKWHGEMEKASHRILRRWESRRGHNRGRALPGPF